MLPLVGPSVTTLRVTPAGVVGYFCVAGKAEPGGLYFKHRAPRPDHLDLVDDDIVQLLCCIS
jgi:hypothetical protein